MEPEVMVTGTGRCGTVAFAEMLNRAGYPAGHERFWGPSQHNTVWPIDVSAVAAPFAADWDRALMRLVRHPLDVVSSFLHIGFFADRTHPWRVAPNGAVVAAAFRFDDTDPLRTAVRYYIEWNGLIPECRTVRIEDVTAADLVWCGDQAGLEDQGLAEEAIAATGTTTNTWGKHVRVSWADVERTGLSDELDEVASRFGY